MIPHIGFSYSNLRKSFPGGIVEPAWPHRLTVRTEASQALNRGSIPRRVTTYFLHKIAPNGAVLCLKIVVTLRANSLGDCLRGNRKAFEVFLEGRTEISKRSTVHVMKGSL